MDLQIITESQFWFSIELNGKSYMLKQAGGEWRLDGLWIASRRIDWPEALARALRVAANMQPNVRTRTAMALHNE